LRGECWIGRSLSLPRSRSAREAGEMEVCARAAGAVSASSPPSLASSSSVRSTADVRRGLALLALLSLLRRRVEVVRKVRTEIVR